MSERDRLTSNLFLVASIRSNKSRSVFRDIIALCRQNIEIFFCSNLKFEKYTCLITDYKLKLNRYVICLLSVFSIHT